MSVINFFLISKNVDVLRQLLIAVIIALLGLIIYLIIINIRTLRTVIKLQTNKKENKIDDERYHELNNKIQLLIVVSSIILLIGGFLGYNSIDTIKSGIQDNINEYAQKLNDYEAIIAEYNELIPSLETERKATSESLSKIKIDYENAVRSLEQLQNEYRLSAKTYFVKGIQISQQSINENTKHHRTYFKDLKKINNRIPVVFKEEPFLTVVGIGGFAGLSILKITREYFEFDAGGSVELEYGLLDIFPLLNEDSNNINKEEIKISNYINSLLNKSIERQSKTDAIPDATSFDLIIIEGINQ